MFTAVISVFSQHLPSQFFRFALLKREKIHYHFRHFCEYFIIIYRVIFFTRASPSWNFSWVSFPDCGVNRAINFWFKPFLRPVNFERMWKFISIIVAWDKYGLIIIYISYISYIFLNLFIPIDRTFTNMNFMSYSNGAKWHESPRKYFKNKHFMFLNLFSL